eukprot:82162_1
MSCPSATLSIFQHLPALTIEILFIYLLITRFSVGFLCISLAIGSLCFVYCIYCKYKHQTLYDFHHDKTNRNDKHIPMANAPDTKRNNDIIVYCFKITKNSMCSYASTNAYPFASPLNFNLSSKSIPSKEINAMEFIQLWKQSIIKPYCIDPYNLSVWFIDIHPHNAHHFNHLLVSNQYNWNQTCQTYSQCTLYRISKPHFIALCMRMQKQTLLKSAKFASTHLCFIYDTDFDHTCSIGDNLAYALHLMNASANNDHAIHYISNHCACTGLQFRYVQLKRSMNKSQIKQFKSQLMMLFHYYFIFLYGSITYNTNSCNVVLKMNSSDIFWNDFLYTALPALKKDIYISICTSYPYHYMLQETVHRFEDFHSDFLHSSDDDEGQINIHTRDKYIMNQRATVFDLSCRILAVFVYVMRCLDKNKEKEKGITEMKANFYMIRYDTDLCDKGMSLLLSLMATLGWNSNSSTTANESKIIKLFKATKHANFYPKILTERQMKRVSLLLAQYEGIDYVHNIQ